MKPSRYSRSGKKRMTRFLINLLQKVGKIKRTPKFGQKDMNPKSLVKLLGFILCCPDMDMPFMMVISESLFYADALSI